MTRSEIRQLIVQWYGENNFDHKAKGHDPEKFNAVCRVLGVRKFPDDPTPSFATDEEYQEVYRRYFLPQPPPAKTDEDDGLKERVLSVLTGPQRELVAFLWDRGTASFDKLSSLPGVWRDEGEHVAVKRQVDRIRQVWTEADILDVSLVIRGERVNLVRQVPK